MLIASIHKWRHSASLVAVSLPLARFSAALLFNACIEKQIYCSVVARMEACERQQIMRKLAKLLGRSSFPCRWRARESKADTSSCKCSCNIDQSAEWAFRF